MQTGVFTPFLRTHTVINTPSQEPWSFGDQVEDISRTHINLRYQLMPYIYSAFEQSSATGVPVMRPMFMEFQDDAECYQDQNSLQYMFGEDFLVAPVTQMGSTFRKVYLPRGRWTDFWTEATYDGGRYLIVEAPLERLPLFVREGAIIFSRPVQQYIGEKEMNQLIVDVYPGQMSSGTLYEDDGVTFDHEKGAACRTSFSLNMLHHQSLAVTKSERKGGFTPAARTIKLRVHGQSAAPARLAINDKLVEKGRQNFQPDKKVLEIEFADEAAKQTIELNW